MPEPVHITDRELEVLQMIVREHTNQEIAEKLYISPRTVDAHRRNLLQKTGARNTAGLVKYAFQQGLVNND
jgi:DNA-binding CsgD family transcriptional regulator